MVDFLTKAERSERMARIRSGDTLPERLLRSELHRLGLRFRLRDKRLPGKPDLVLAKHRSVVFVHGCFWHRHQACSIATTPKSNGSFWLTKFARNVERDKEVAGKLQSLGWRVFIVWECEVQSRVKAKAAAALLQSRITAEEQFDALGA